MVRSRILFALVALLGALPGSARATHEETGLFEIPAFNQWTKSHLTVLIVPPNHGQIFNFETDVLNGGDPSELTTSNSYVKPIEDAIHAWDAGIDYFGQQWLKDSFELDVYLLGRDDVPSNVLTDPDILVLTDESEGPALGTAVRLSPCIVRMSKLYLTSFTVADMYNVTLQEFGHCLGLSHVGSQGGVDPTSDQKHPEHDPMNGFYTHSIGSAGTHLHCISNLDVIGVEFVFSYPADDGTIFMPVNAYGSTCEPPAADWRSRLPEGSSFSPSGPGEPQPSPQPSPDPEPSEDPDPEEPSDPDPAAPSAEIWSPQQDASLARSGFRLIEGTVYSDGDGDPTVEVALAQTKGAGCRWWDAASRRLVRGDCDEPLWNSVDGWAAWRLKVKKSLPAGSYRALARASMGNTTEECCELGRNEIHFLLY